MKVLSLEKAKTIFLFARLIVPLCHHLTIVESRHDSANHASILALATLRLMND